ncbi:MAG: acetolactate synthase [Geodermatophilaceae bacterium]|nr:acetolactate synthase [Geodermatophilaceae bacterium]
MSEARNNVEGHGGDLALAALRRYGVEELFTLSGAHVFPLYDAMHTSGLPIHDVRHEATAVFAAEATSKLKRRPAVAALTAGPGVTNGISAVTTAQFNGSAVMVIGGRAPHFRWGSGSLQEIDHVPILASITKHAATSTSVDAIPDDVDRAMQAALSGHRGPVFLDIPMDVFFSRAEVRAPSGNPPSRPAADPDRIAEAARVLAEAQRPVVLAGTDVYADGAWHELAEAARALRLPVFSNGMGRGCLPADDELAFSRARRTAFQQADVIAVIGTPLDFRLGFGDFGAARVVHIVDDESQHAPHLKASVRVSGDLRAVLGGLAEYGGTRADHEPWLLTLREAEIAARDKEGAALGADSDPVKPSRVYGELRKALDRDAVVICDGGDFVSYAGKYLDAYTPGCWLDPGPYGCLGTSMGYAMGARLSRPSSQVCVVLGDGAAGFSLMDAESLVRQQLPVVIVVGNNGIWGLEKHPMQQLYGYDVAADLQPGLHYDQVVSALGGAGETVIKAVEIAPALARAFEAGVPYVVNVLTDPTDAYPRSSSLA